MELSGIRLGRRSDTELDALVASARSAAPTYDHVRSTLGTTPAGVDDRTSTLDVDGSLEAARRALGRWATHDGIGATIHPRSASVTDGETLVVVVRAGPFEMAVPNRVVAVVDERDRFGFAYGTLPGHQESGEELFLAERSGSSRVRLTVRIHARPARVLARLAGPIAPLLQAGAARRYLAAWAAAIEQERR